MDSEGAEALDSQYTERERWKPQMWRVVVQTLMGQEYVYELDAPSIVHTNELVSSALKAHSIHVALNGAPLAVEVTEMSYKVPSLAKQVQAQKSTNHDEWCTCGNPAHTQARQGWEDHT